MDLRAAYVVLELEPGASEEAVRDARKVLAKVWHPDRHANDPELQKRAEIKLAEVNAAYEVVRAAKFPSSIPGAAASPKAAPTPKPEPPPRPAPKPTRPIEFVPRRRVRWPVVLLLVAAVGAGAYFAIVKLGATTRTTPAAPRDAATAVVVAPIAPADAAAVVVAPPLPPLPTPTPKQPGATFGLGSTRDEVTAVQGQPSDRQSGKTEDWSYGASTVSFNKRGKVVGWWDRDDVLDKKLEPADPAVAAQAKALGHYAIGSSKDEVIGVQGTPSRIDVTDDETWYYGKESNLVFNSTGRVRGYHNVNGELSLE